MHKGILSQWLNDHAVIGHAVRAAALLRVVQALLTGGRLSLTYLCRHLDGTAREKHQIKAVDQLLGNENLQRLYGDVRSAHIHAGEFPLGEHGRPRAFSLIMDPVEESRQALHIECYNLTREAIVNWLLSLLPREAGETDA
jgi:hypothetical protein